MLLLVDFSFCDNNSDLSRPSMPMNLPSEEALRSVGHDLSDFDRLNNDMTQKAGESMYLDHHKAADDEIFYSGDRKNMSSTRSTSRNTKRWVRRWHFTSLRPVGKYLTNIFLKVPNY